MYMFNAVFRISKMLAKADFCPRPFDHPTSCFLYRLPRFSAKTDFVHLIDEGDKPAHREVNTIDEDLDGRSKNGRSFSRVCAPSPTQKSVGANFSRGHRVFEAPLQNSFLNLGLGIRLPHHRADGPLALVPGSPLQKRVCYKMQSIGDENLQRRNALRVSP